MAKRYKFRYVNQVAGTFVLLGLILLVGAIVFASYAQRWFESVHEVTVYLPEDGSFGLRKNSEIRLLGTVVGTVQEVRLPKEGRMQARITVRSDFARFVCDDSRAVIKRHLGLGGESYLEITRGTGAPLPREGGLLEGEADRHLAELLAEMVGQVRNEVLPTFHEYRELARELRDPEGGLLQALASLNRLTRNLEKGEGILGKLLSDPALAGRVEKIIKQCESSLERLPPILAQAGEVSADLEKVAAILRQEAKLLPDLMEETREALRAAAVAAEGFKETTDKVGEISDTVAKETKRLPELVSIVKESMGQLQGVLKDFDVATRKMAEILDSTNEELKHVPALVQQTSKTLTGATEVVADVRKTTKSLTEIMEATREEMEALPALVLQTHKTLAEIEKLVQGMQRHWMVRKYIGQPGAGGRISPAEAIVEDRNP